MKCVPILLCAASLAIAQYPLISTADPIYHSFDLPEADTLGGEDAYWESLKWGVDSPIPVIRQSDGGSRFYAFQWNKTWKFEAPSQTDPDDVLGMKAAEWIHTRDFFWQDPGSVLPVSDTGLIRNNRVFKFIMNTYKAEDGDLYALMHIEDNRACGANQYTWPQHFPPSNPMYCDGSRYRIGLARCASNQEEYPCDDGGWQFLGVVLGTSFDSAYVNGGWPDTNKNYFSNIGGAPYMVRDGFIYVYFTEQINPAPLPYWAYREWMTVARAPLEDVFDQADGGTAGGSSSPWRKFSGFGGSCTSGDPHAAACWTQDPITGIGAMLPNNGGLDFGNVNSHTDMVYSTVTGKYYMPIVYPLDANGGTTLDLYSSADGIIWSNLTTIETGTRFSYPSVIPVEVERASDDGSKVGGRFYVVFSQSNILDIDSYGRNSAFIYRYKVTLAPPNAAARVDYDGDGISDLSVKAETAYDGEIRVDLSSNGFTGQDDVLPVSFLSGVNDIAVPADYDGDGLTDYSGKAENGDWGINYAVDGIGYSGWNYYYRDGSSQTWGDADCVPVPADYDGDGRADLSVFCKELYSSRWDIDLSSDGFNGVDSGRAGYFTSTHHPVPADYNGDGKADMAFKDDVLGSWHIDYAPLDNGFTWDVNKLYYAGGDTGIAVPADYNGDDTADISIFSTASGTWFIDTIGNGFGSWDVYYELGWSGFDPSPGDYDGDGKLDLAAKDDASGDWHVDYSWNGFGATDTIFEGWGGGDAHPLYKKATREEMTLSQRAGQILLSFALPKASKVQIHAYTADGKRAATLYDANLPEGSNRLSWNRQDLATKGLKRGLYFISLRADGYKGSKRLMLTD